MLRNILAVVRFHACANLKGICILMSLADFAPLQCLYQKNVLFIPKLYFGVFCLKHSHFLIDFFKVEYCELGYEDP